MDELTNHTLGGFPMTKLKSLVTGTTAIVLLVGVPSWAAEQPGLGIANNDSVYIDGNSFKIVPGKGKGDASALIKKLDARELGAGEIIFRSGGKLYAIAALDQQLYGSDRRDYGSDRRDYASDRYGSDRRDYASDRVVINDPEYAQYKLKKIFEDNWTASETK